jgi:hypothetical protein
MLRDLWGYTSGTAPQMSGADTGLCCISFSSHKLLGIEGVNVYYSLYAEKLI